MLHEVTNHACHMSRMTRPAARLLPACCLASLPCLSLAASILLVLLFCFSPCAAYLYYVFKSLKRTTTFSDSYAHPPLVSLLVLPLTAHTTSCPAHTKRPTYGVGAVLAAAMTSAERGLGACVGDRVVRTTPPLLPHSFSPSFFEQPYARLCVRSCLGMMIFCY